MVKKINFIDATFSTSLNVDHCRDSRQPADGLTLNACCVQLLHAWHWSTDIVGSALGRCKIIQEATNVSHRQTKEISVGGGGGERRRMAYVIESLCQTGRGER